MKRLLILILLILPLTASAQMTDTLLTPDGTLYAIEVEQASDHPDVSTESTNFFALITRNGEETSREVIPATLVKGSHSDPAIAYDSESGMMFLFWLHHEGLLYNELLVATRTSAGEWSAPTLLGDPWDFRENLRIAVTRKVDDVEAGTKVPGITVHATWWEFDSSTGVQAARYAMLVIENGEVVDVQGHALRDFIEAASESGSGTPEETAAEISPDVLKQPILSTSPQADSVLVTFGDLATRSLHQVELHPTKIASDVRIRVPIGRSGRDVPAPRFAAASNGRMEAIYGDSGRLALYVTEGDVLHYVVMRDGVWSEMRSLTLGTGISADRAVTAIGRLVIEQ